MPLVSVVMNCLDSERYLREAIDSVYAQTHSDWEIVFVDNGSRDASPRIAKSYDSRLRYLRNDQTVALGRARNQALQAARGELICFLDCDDRWLAHKLARQIAFLHAHPRVEFLHSNFYFIDARGRRTATGYRRQQPDGQVFGNFLRHFELNLQTVMVRKPALERLDELFDATLSLAEDYDLFMRLLHDAELGYIHEPLAEYRVHSEQNTARFPKRFGEEMQICFDKLRRKFPDIERVHAAELGYLAGKVAYWKARGAMAQGTTAEARALLAPYRGSNWHFGALYLLTYLGPGIWHALHALRYHTGRMS